MRQTLLALLPPDSPEGDYPIPPMKDEALLQAMAEFAEATAELEQQNRETARAAMPILPPRPNLT